MRYDIQYRINNDINLKKFIRENSYWYKALNRDSDNFKYFVQQTWFWVFLINIYTWFRFNRYINICKPLYSYLPNNKFKKVVFPFPFLPIKPNFQFVSILNETFSKILSG